MKPMIHSTLTAVLRHARLDTDDGLQHVRALNLLKYAIGTKGLDSLRPLADSLSGVSAKTFVAKVEDALVDVML